jgi:hypothetical protein
MLDRQVAHEGLDLGLTRVLVFWPADVLHLQIGTRISQEFNEAHDDRTVGRDAFHFERNASSVTSSPRMVARRSKSTCGATARESAGCQWGQVGELAFEIGDPLRQLVPVSFILLFLGEPFLRPGLINETVQNYYDKKYNTTLSCYGCRLCDEKIWPNVAGLDV